MSQLTEDLIAKLKSTHGEHLTAVKAPDGTMLVFRRPTRQEYTRWFDAKAAKKPATINDTELATCCIAWPDAGALRVTLDNFPGLLGCQNGIVDAIITLAGADGEAQEAPKKL